MNRAYFNGLKVVGRKELPDGFVFEISSNTAFDSFRFNGAQGQYDAELYSRNNTLVQTYIDLIGDETITFPTGTKYFIRIIPKGANPFSTFALQNEGRFRGVVSWGDEIIWSSFLRIFRGTQASFFPPGAIPNVQNVIRLDQFVQSVPQFTFVPKGFFDNFVNATNMRNAFDRPGVLSIPVGFLNNCVNVTNYDNFLRGADIGVESLSRLYIELEATNSNSNVPFHGGVSKYDPDFTIPEFPGKTTSQARNDLIARGWQLTDGGTI